jgi:DNA-binding NtrC family response regulator
VERPTPTDTITATAALSRHALSRRSGLALVFSGARPLLRTFPVGSGLTLGRGDLPDDRLSRVHAEVRFEGGRCRARDLGSRNGTFVDGQRVQGAVATGVARVLRLADSLFLPFGDLAPLEDPALGGTLDDGTLVAGPALRRALAEVRQAAAGAGGVLVTGESGAGKELAARAFHAAGRHAAGPFVAVNCATIAQGVAERLLFGARRGAYSGADADAPGYVQAAHRGVLFLDEVGELDALVQAKLLRVLETKEVLPLGAVRPVPVDLSVCWATNRNLRTEVAAGRFRADLYYRIASHHVTLPPLRQRPEEIPSLVARALAEVDGSLRAHGLLVEACLLRPWPGNVRELLGAVRAAAARAHAEGVAVVLCQHLDPSAGEPIGDAPADAAPPTERAAPAGGGGSGSDLKSAVSEAERRQIEKALDETNGNRELAARRLGVSRRTLYYKLRAHGIE